MVELDSKHCVPCEGGIPPFTEVQENELMPKVPGWTISRLGIHKIVRLFQFKNFRQSMEFVNKVADLAEQEGHHPNIKINYNRVELELFTHAIKGLFENDFILAAKINKIADQK